MFRCKLCLCFFSFAKKMTIFLLKTLYFFSLHTLFLVLTILEKFYDVPFLYCLPAPSHILVLKMHEEKLSSLPAIPLSNYFVYCTMFLMKTLYLHTFFYSTSGFFSLWVRKSGLVVNYSACTLK